MTEDWQNGGFGLYVHWPFCLHKCPYCDFNSHVAGEVDQDRWARAFLSELERVAAVTPGRVLNSVFFGGGTPSLMDPEVVRAVLERALLLWTPANDIEVTLEANPTSVEAGRFAGYRDAGVNRVSMGVQALNDADLRRLGRMHTADEAMTAFGVARHIFDRVSFDLIYTRQYQTVAAWRDELGQALGLGLDHLSAYQLTIEENTVFGARAARGQLPGLPDDDAAADMYFVTQELCDAAGLPAYEVSNHARPGFESRHNLIYWRYGDYAGIGPGAHGRLTVDGTKWATETALSPSVWLRRVEKDGSGETGAVAVMPGEQSTEMLLMGLRLIEGIDVSRFEALSGKTLNKNRCLSLLDDGAIEVDRGRLRATTRGLGVLNFVITELLSDR